VQVWGSGACGTQAFGGLGVLGATGLLHLLQEARGPWLCNPVTPCHVLLRQWFAARLPTSQQETASICH
jgi:hypothetical protein